MLCIGCLPMQQAVSEKREVIFSVHLTVTKVKGKLTVEEKKLEIGKIDKHMKTKAGILPGIVQCSARIPTF